MDLKQISWGSREINIMKHIRFFVQYYVPYLSIHHNISSCPIWIIVFLAECVLFHLEMEISGQAAARRCSAGCWGSSLGAMYDAVQTQTSAQCRHNDEQIKSHFGVTDIFKFCDRVCSIVKKFWCVLPRLRHYPLHLHHQKWRMAFLFSSSITAETQVSAKPPWSLTSSWSRGGSLCQRKNNGWGCCPDRQSKCSVWIEQDELQIPLQNWNPPFYNAV